MNWPAIEIHKKLTSLHLRMLFLGLYFIVHTGLFCQIQGKVIQSDTKAPVSFATVQLQYRNGGTKFLIADSAGLFMLDTAGLNIVRISRSGFYPFEKEITQPEQDNLVFELTVFVQTLSPIEIRSHKPLVEGDVSKITYDISRDSTLLNKTAAEAVSRLPFISIDALNNISYKGKQSFLVLVNGNRFGVLTDNPNLILKSIPADMIQRAELIFDPPLEYKLKGYTAVINIITRPGYYKGVLGAVGGSGNTIREYESSPYFSWQHNQTYLQLSFYHRNFKYRKKLDSDIEEGFPKERLQQQNEYTTKSSLNRVSISLDQRLNASSRVGFFSTLSGTVYNETGSSRLITEKNGVTEENLVANNLNGRDGYFDLGADFNQVYGKTNNFSVLTKYSSEYSRIITSSGSQPSSRNYFRQPPHEFSLQVTNNIRLKKNVNWESIGKYISRSVNSISSTDTLVNNQWESLNTEGSGQFDFTIYNIINQLTFRTKKTAARAGFTLDYANYQAAVSTMSISKKVLNLLPFSTIRFLINKSQYISLDYRANLYRPTYRSLAGNIPVYDALVITEGNPALGTNINHQISSSFSLYFNKSQSSVYSDLNVEFSNSFFNTYSAFDSLINKRIIRYRQSRYLSLFFTAGGDFELSSKWSLSGSGSIGFTKVGDNESGYPVYETNSSVTYSINPNTGVQLLIDYRSKYITSMGYLTGYGTYDLNYYWFLFKRKLQVNIMASNFFQKTLVQKEIINGNGFSALNLYGRPFQSFQLSLNYRFGNLKTFELKSKRLSNNDIRKID